MPFRTMRRNRVLVERAEETNRSRGLGLRRGAGPVAASIAAHLRSFVELGVLIELQPFARSL
jgi:hypothetical protein